MIPTRFTVACLGATLLLLPVVHLSADENATRKTGPALMRPPVNFNHPPREYETRRARDWTVLVEKELATGDPDLTRLALERLDKKLGEAMAALPASAHERLKKLTLFLMAGARSPHGGRDNGLEYFPRSAPAARADLDPRMGGSIVIYSATNWMKQTEFWALKALVHEFAHAQHLEQWPETRADMFDAWQHARQEGLYRHVKDDGGAIIDEAYALQNHLEYFAEISCAYFVGCNYAPFDRAGLKAYDPTGFALVEKLWNVACDRRVMNLEGWTVLVSETLLEKEKPATDRALELLAAQLKGIGRDVPAAAVAHLRTVPLWISPEYPGVKPRAEYHPDARWLRQHGRDPAMAQGVEFTNVRIFENEVKRMPVFVLHELSHAYHDQVLGNDNAEIKAAFEHARAAGKYDHVERWNGPGKPTTRERAYAMTNPQEYFAECSEAFFGRNDFFPFVRDELAELDPEMFQLLKKLWQAD